MATVTKKKWIPGKNYVPNPINVNDMPTVLEFFKMQLKETGTLSADYHMFKHTLSIGNSIAVAWQAAIRGLELGPTAPYSEWQEKGRQVKKGEKGLYVLHPNTRTGTREDKKTGEEEEYTFTTFFWKATRYLLCQTDGEPLPEPDFKDWDIGKAMCIIEVEPEAYHGSGSSMGYCHERYFAINPLGHHQAATTFHELAHIVLGHTEEGWLDDTADRTPRNLREFEAEGTAMLVLDILGEKDHTESVGYMKNWFASGAEDPPEKSIRKIMKAADTIVKAGY
jgi:antirestriction protein ArdC